MAFRTLSSFKALQKFDKNFLTKTSTRFIETSKLKDSMMNFFWENKFSLAINISSMFIIHLRLTSEAKELTEQCSHGELENLQQ